MRCGGEDKAAGAVSSLHPNPIGSRKSTTVTKG